MADEVAAAGSRPVVTLFEAYGAGASYIGPRVAQALGAPYHQQAFSSEELEQAAVEHESEGMLSRVFSAMGGSYTTFGGLDAGIPIAQRDSHNLVVENTRQVQEDALEGGVIVGRNGAFILADWPTALNVKLDGPLENRVARAAQEAGIDLARARKRQKREDQIRADMSIELYGWNPQEPEGYDMVVNTGTMDLDLCVEIIVSACRLKAARAGAAVT